MVFPLDFWSISLGGGGGGGGQLQRFFYFFIFFMVIKGISYKKCKAPPSI
jgi:hypothetical protein